MYRFFPAHSHWRYPALAVCTVEVTRDHGPASRTTLATPRNRDYHSIWFVGSAVTLALVFLTMAHSRFGWALQALVQAMLVMVHP